MVPTKEYAEPDRDAPDAGEIHASAGEVDRQVIRLETACSLIQGVVGSLSLDGIVTAVVENLVEVGGFAGAELVIEATVDALVLDHRASAGSTTSDEALTRRTPVFVRGLEVGTLTTRCDSAEVLDDQTELLEFVLPTMLMGLEHAVSFAEVVDYRATLEQKVVDRTAELAAANQQLAHTLDELHAVKMSRDQFFANINHEIRTPVTLIRLAAEEIGRTNSGPVAPNVQQGLDEIGSASKRLLYLVNSLLQLAAGDEGKLRIRPRALDAAGTLRQLVRDWSNAAARGGIALRYDGPDECRASLDEAALETILGNFVSNAMKFTPRDGSITVRLRATDDQIEVAVRDTGPGIDPAFIPKLFGRFERSDSATKSGVRGTGIGLSLSKQLVDLQGGDVEVIPHTEPRGTSFIISVPRHQDAVIAEPAIAAEPVVPIAASDRPAHATAPVPVATAPEGTIVLAEDDPALAQHVSRILASKYTVHVAENGRAALELAAKHHPDMLVTDLEMPEMNGIELTRAFLALEGMALSPVLIVSAHVGLGERLAGFDAGAIDYVVKPFSADELLARVRSQLAMRQLALKLHEHQKLAAMGMLSAGLAHELRNPANAVVNGLEPLFMLLPEAERRPGSTGSALYEILSVAASQMRERCANILEFSRTGTVVSRREDVHKLISRARLVLSHQLTELAVVEHIDVAEPVLCAGPLIEQILINLLDNAAHAAGRGGSITIDARREHALVAIEVSDSGPGVPVELQDRIFDPFFTTKPVGEGSGLGLAVSRRIALNHGGDLRLVRHASRCVFRLELPQAGDGAPRDLGLV